MRLSDKLRESGIESIKRLADYADKTPFEKDRLVRLLTGKSDIVNAYEMGKDYGKNGATELNCHFSIFTTVEGTEAWERGKAGDVDLWFPIPESYDGLTKNLHPPSPFPTPLCRPRL